MDANQAKPPSFEEALSQLETIVDSMESGDVPLEELLNKFEKGNRLLQVCETKLKEAELRIEQLKKTGNSPALSRFEPEKDTS